MPPTKNDKFIPRGTLINLIKNAASTAQQNTIGTYTPSVDDFRFKYKFFIDRLVLFTQRIDEYKDAIQALSLTGDADTLRDVMVTFLNVMHLALEDLDQDFWVEIFINLFNQLEDQNRFTPAMIAKMNAVGRNTDDGESDG